MKFVDIALGTVFHDIHSTKWIYIGWRPAKDGHVVTGKRMYYFARVVATKDENQSVWHYKSSTPETLVKRFPELKAFIL